MAIWDQWPFRLLRPGEPHASNHEPVVWDTWPSRWQAAVRSCSALGGQARELSIAKPATAKDLRQVEHALGTAIPGSFRSVLSGFAARVSMSWYLPEEIAPPDELRGIFCGICQWDLAQLVALDGERLRWVKSRFPDPDDAYHRVWHHKLPFLGVGNGDLLALDLDQAPEPPVLYLSHDDSAIHGCVLGTSFVDFIDRWTLLGCPGPEDFQMRPFIKSRDHGIDPGCADAMRWRDWFGLAHS